MKISDINIDGFGVWSGLEVDDLAGNMTVFFGRNEAGKTTLMQFVRAVLYGFSPERRQRYLPPVHGGAAGGALRLNGAGGAVEVRRHYSLEDDPSGLGDVTVTNNDGVEMGDNRLQQLLSGVDEAIFNNVFAVGLREFQQLSALEETEAAQQLYRLTSGLDRVSLLDVVESLETTRNEILSADGGPSQIVQLLEEHEQRKRQEEEAAKARQRWLQARTRRRRIGEEINQLRQEIDSLQQQARMAEAALQIFEPWQERHQLNQEIAALGPLADVSGESIRKLVRIQERLQKRQRRLAHIKQQRRKLRSQAAELPKNGNLWSQAARIEALGEQGPWITSLQQQTRELDTEIAGLREELDTQCQQLGLSHQSADENFSGLSRRTLSALRGPARAIREETRRRSEAQWDLEKHDKQAEQLDRQLRSELDHRGHADLSDALEASGKKVAQLRRRLQLEERADEIVRMQDELEARHHDLLQRQVLPPWVLVGLGGLFALGVMLILTGLIGGTIFSLSAGAGWSLALLGAGGTGAAVAAKAVMERSAARQLENNIQQQELLETQSQQVQSELEELDKQIPVGGGALDSRLEAAQKELEGLESLLPLDTQRQALRQQSESARVRLDRAEHDLQDARRRWRDALRSAGLPDTLSPRNVGNLSERSERIAHLRRRLDARLQEHQQRSRELQMLRDRIDQICREVELEHIAEDPIERLDALAAALSSQQHIYQRRQALRRQDRRYRRRQNRLSVQIEELTGRRRALMTQTGVTDAEQLEAATRLRNQADQLVGQRDALTARIDAVLAGINGEATATERALREVGGGNRKKIEQIWEQRTEQIEAAQGQLNKLHQRDGQLQQELQTLVSDRRLDESRLELGCLEHRLEEAIRRWQTLAVVALLLKDVRHIYETERQPATLLEASDYLNQMTSGQYVRVWTPFGKDVLRVDNGEGESLPLEVLSRGTREAVFLSLRLALASSYARRGASLPLILDDVLVNFDIDRIKAAAAVLRKFAGEGHQLLLFTCHEHIMKAFKSAKVPVRQLPSRVAASKPAIAIVEEEEPEQELIPDEEAAELEEVVEEELVEDEPEEEDYEEDELEEEDGELADDEEEYEEEEDEYDDEEYEYEEEEDEEEDDITMEVEDFDEADEEEPDGSFQWDSDSEWEDDESGEAA